MGNLINDFVVNEMEFQKQGPFWHLCTPGESQEIIFKMEEDYKFGVTSAAVALHEANSSGHKVRLYAFAVMSNHIHDLVSGTREDCLEYFRIRRAKLRRYLPADVDLSDFECKLLEVKDLKYFRNLVSYINRNGFVNNPRETPFSYEWSSGMYYFNPAAKRIPLVKASELKYVERRKVFKSRGDNVVDSMLVYNGYVSPLCFCEIAKGEDLFMNAHKYFYGISRSVEAYGQIARMLGDRIFLNDEEMFGVVCRKAKELYDCDMPKLLAPEQKVEMARLMHFTYNASNAQIDRILKMGRAVVDGMFPTAHGGLG